MKRHFEERQADGLGPHVTCVHMIECARDRYDEQEGNHKRSHMGGETIGTLVEFTRRTSWCAHGISPILPISRCTINQPCVDMLDSKNIMINFERTVLADVVAEVREAVRVWVRQK